MNQELLHSFHQCLRYWKATPLIKPLIDPVRCTRNQLRQKFRKVPGSVERVDTFHAKGFTIVSGEVVSEGLACYGFMEPELTEALLHLVKPGHVSVDIGMHLGYFTTLLAALVGQGGKVYSFEPTPSTREIAYLNTSRFKNVSVYPNAMWSHRETMTFHDYGLTHMAFNSLTTARLDHEVIPVNEHRVESFTLDEFRDQLDHRIDIVKIDAENAEEQILQGARRLLHDDRPIITLEVGDEASEDGKSRRLIETMANMDYHPWEFCEGSFKRHDPRTKYTYDNLVFAPSNQPLA